MEKSRIVVAQWISLYGQVIVEVGRKIKLRLVSRQGKSECRQIEKIKEGELGPRESSRVDPSGEESELDSSIQPLDCRSGSS